MQYAVIRSGGKQYKIKVGDTIELDKISPENKNIVFDDVLLVVDSGAATVGKPIISGARVEAKLIENIKGKKIRVMKFKAKSRYRRITGFRPQLSVVKIEKIETSSKNAQEKNTKTAPKTS